MSPKDAPALFSEGELAEAPAPLVQQAYDLWNEYANRNKWSEAKVLDTGRRSALKRAVKDYGALTGFRAALEKIQRSDFVMGRVAPRDGHKQFVATLDWFIRPVTVRKVIEDFYNGATVATSTGGSIANRSAPEDSWGRWMRDYTPGKFWPSQLGPRPEEHGCRAPAAMLDGLRTRLGITVAERVVETLEERLRATIASHTRLGNYAKANEIEIKLADLEGRPPVLVPAPSVAMVGMPEPAPRDHPYRAKPRPREAEATRQMATAQDAEWIEIPEGEDGAGPE